MTTLTINVTGLPKGQPRARACIRGRHAGTYNPATADDWKACIAAATTKHIECAELPLFSGPTRVDVTFYFPRPKGHYRNNGELKPNAPTYHTSKPDRDNCDKAVLDILTQRSVLADDAQVADGKITKLYVGIGQAPGCRIHIITLQ